MPNKTEDVMNIYEIAVRIYILRDIPISLIYGELTKYIDGYLGQNGYFCEFHQKKCLKGYNFDLPIKIEKGRKVYKSDQIYQFRIRTVDKELLSYLLDGIADYKTDSIKGLTRTVKQIPHRSIVSVWTLTPVILKNADGKGYWRDCMSFEEFEQELTASLIHQYEQYTKEEIKKDSFLYNQIELKSKCAIGIPYKGITLLGDKLSLQIADNETAQKVMYFTLANGMGTMGSRGMGFLGYRFV